MLFGKKKKEEAVPMRPAPTIPVSQVLSMTAQGISNSQIANQLRAQGFNLTQIRDAFSQAEIKSAVMPGAPSPGLAPSPEMPGAGMPEMPSVPEMPELDLPEVSPVPGVPMSPEMPGAGMPEMPPLPGVPASPGIVPTPSIMPSAPGMEQLVNELQRIIEEIIEEKWRGVEDKLSDLDIWKTRLEDQVTALDSKITTSTGRIDEFSRGLVDRTEEYKETVEDVGTQMEAIEKMMGKLVPSLAEEIKELRGVVDKLKKK